MPQNRYKTINTDNHRMLLREILKGLNKCKEIHSVYCLDDSKLLDVTSPR